MNGITLQRSVQAVLLVVLTIAGLIWARPFLVPIAFAILLAFVLLPVCRWLEAKGAPKALAVVSCLLLILVLVSGVGWLVAWQVTDLASDASAIEKSLLEKWESLQAYLSKSFGISPQKQQEVLKQQGGSGDKLGPALLAFFNSASGILTNFLLVLVYLFLFLFYRRHLKEFALRWAGGAHREAAATILQQAAGVVQSYLGGLAAMIVCLWVLYGIGFSIIGVKNAVFFAILCGLLEIVPFVGNLTGTALTILVTIAQGGSSTTVLWIVVVYATVQAVQTYLLEPLVVGSKVNIHPLATIIGIIAAELVWGIPGMVLAIPVMGVAKLVCDRLPALRPYGFLLGKNG